MFMNDLLGSRVSRLGFGAMRLPENSTNTKVSTKGGKMTCRLKIQ